MRDTLLIILGLLLSPIMTLVVLAMLVARGSLGTDLFHTVPARQCAIRFVDLFFGFWILLAGGVLLFGPLFQMIDQGYFAQQGGHIAHELAMLLKLKDLPPVLPGDPLRMAIISLLGQATTQLPVVLFIFYRLASAPVRVDTLGDVGTAGEIVAPGEVAAPNEFAAFGFSKLRRLHLKSGVLAFLAAMPMVTGTSAICVLIGNQFNLESPAVGHEMLKTLLDSQSPLASLLMIISAVIVAPVLEEIVFRGLVQSSLLALLGAARRWTVILVAAALFSFIHIQGVSWHVLPGLFILGVVLGWLYEKHGSLWPCIVVHVLFNLANVVLGMLQAME